MSSCDEIRLASRDLGGGLYQADLSVPGMRCAACIGKIEKGLAQIPGVETARVNLTAKRVSVTWRGEVPPDLIGALDHIGFQSHLASGLQEAGDPELGRLIRALCVAGFGAMNIMMLSVGVWAGADGETRQIFHWISAAIALPCLIYAGQVFFRSAWTALRRGHTNMDVPISIGVCLAFGLSLYDTFHHGPHAYFEASISLLFFLLIGRTLDHVMRARARTAVAGLARLAPRGVTVRHADGRREYLPLDRIEPGMQLLLAVGDRVPVDGQVVEGASDLDCALATGESLPRPVHVGQAVPAGVLNLTAPLVLVATSRAETSFLGEMVRLMQAAESGRAAYRRLADRAASLYAPVVHAAALMTFVGWMALGAGWHASISTAIAVLIITCPCALGLAAPMVQVMASGRLFASGVMVKDGAAMERLAGIDTVVFDKTGTLTLGRPRLTNLADLPPEDMAAAGLLAARSNHPISRAIAAVAPASSLALTAVSEQPGLGVEAVIDGHRYRLGRAPWALDRPTERSTGTLLTRDGRLVARLELEDSLRPGAIEAVEALKAQGLSVLILSGDDEMVVGDLAARLGVTDFAGGLLPADKVARLEALAREGKKVLMVGDGLNDAPALAAAQASMAPAEAADIGRTVADFVFLHPDLDAVPMTLAVARRAEQLVKQNFALSVGYNVVALPLAVVGLVTPLIAALAMSLSSIIVVANAMRIGGRAVGPVPQQAPAPEVKTPPPTPAKVAA